MKERWGFHEENVALHVNITFLWGSELGNNWERFANIWENTGILTSNHGDIMEYHVIYFNHLIWLKWWTIGHVLKHCRKHWKHGRKITIYHLTTICSWGKFETDQMGKHWERLAKVGGLAIFGWLTSEKKAGFASSRDDDKKLNVRRIETQDNWVRDHHWRINIVSARRFYSQGRHDHHYTIRIGWWRSTILWRFKTLKSGCFHQPKPWCFQLWMPLGRGCWQLSHV